MAQYPFPNWIAPADIPGSTLAGMRQGASIGEAQARQAQVAAEMAQERQIQQERLQAEMLRRQQQEAIQKAYRDAQMGLAQQRIQDEQGRAAELARHNVAMETRGQKLAAEKYLAQQKFAQAYQKHLSAGTRDPMMAALLDVPEMITPTTLSTGTRGMGIAHGLTPSSAASYMKSLQAMREGASEEEKKTIDEEIAGARNAMRQTLGIAPIPPPQPPPVAAPDNTPPPSALDILAGPSPAIPVPPTPGLSGPSSLPVPAAPAAPVIPKEIRRVTKDGRSAIFDANTKQFIRYADAPEDTAPADDNAE